MATGVRYQQAKIIICLDGTSNSEYLTNNPLTNVSRIARCIPSIDNEGKRQLVYYHPGIGTHHGDPLNIYNQALGKGLDEIIFKAYSFICLNYNDIFQDQIILIGFSRGAFAARCIADFIGSFGVLRKNDLHRLHDIYKSWKYPYPARLHGLNIAESRAARVTACAVWDTVSSIGIPLPHRSSSGDFNRVNSDLCHTIDFAFQALSLHEHRYQFRPIVWQDPQIAWSPRRLEQCWFSGYHADAGGGNAKDALAHFALIWMISKLRTWVQFEADGFLNPTLPSGRWTIGGDAGVRQADNSYRLPVEDPMHFSPRGTLYAIAGSKYRIPQTELWGLQGPYSVQVSGENIHSSVRYLTLANLVKRCHCLVNTSPYLAAGRWHWDLLPTATTYWHRPLHPVAPNTIDEETLSELERRMIETWVQYELQMFDDMTHPPGEPAPGTILIHIKTWLVRTMINPEPIEIV